MKIKIAAAVLFAALLSAVPRPAEGAWSVSISFFHDELAPYGRWVSTPAYGEIWYPTVVHRGWAPYVDGEWVYSDCGWTWVSYDPFSDPFHYGTWVWVDPYGWSWVPGYVWGPAWVTWAWTDSYVGWAPLPPSFVIATGGYSGAAVTVAASGYVFAPVAQFAGTNISTVRVASAQNSTFLAHAQRATSFSVSSGLVRANGPPATLVEHATGRTLHQVNVTSLKGVRPTTVTTARAGRIAITAPAHERAAAIKESSAAKTARTAPSTAARHETKSTKGASQRAAASAPVHKEKETAHVSRTEHHAPAAPHPERHAAKPAPRQETAHRQEKPASGPPPAKSVEKRHEPAPAPQPRVHEEHRAAMNRPAEQPHPARAQAPPPQRVEQPHPAQPPPAAAQPPQQHPQPQGQGKGPKKEKGQ
ncbi:MAG TPA: DUF6600 domain-containing protein [Thermoanaerobaculia bacterium]|nr:DUF6600 domain-containing protein [Thermoanaerobaculia bacterium]